MVTAVLDDSFVDGLQPPRRGKRGYYYDRTIPGFGVAVTDKGTKTFFIYRKVGGIPKRITLGHFPEMSVEAAQQTARKIDSAFDDGGAIGRRPPGHGGADLIAVRTVPSRPQKRGFYLGAGALAALACVLVLAIVGARVLQSWNSSQSLQSVISFAIDDHLNHREVTFRSGNTEEIKKELEHELPYAVEIPRISPDFKVIGARAYKIGSNSVAYTLWNAKNNNVYSLLQFMRVDFGVEAAEKPELVRPQGMAVKHTPCEVLYWSKGEYGFVLVADHGELLDGVEPELDSGNSAQAKK